jgi:Family of unknown function (DUF6152)
MVLRTCLRIHVLRCARMLVGLAALGAVPVGLAHHSQGATTSDKQPIVWQGTIARVSWDGPHVMYLVDVPDTAGITRPWQVLGGSPYRLRTRGITKQTLKAGQSVTVAGYLNPLNKLITPVYLAPPGGPKFYVGYVDSDAAFESGSSPSARTL